MTVSCAALTETLLESELFGYEKGAFTGADGQTAENSKWPIAAPFCWTKSATFPRSFRPTCCAFCRSVDFYRVGGNQEVRVDARVIAATNKDLPKRWQGRFRDDLYYRLNVIEIRIPPLRERREDIPLLAEHFVERMAHEMGKEVAEYPKTG